MVHFKGAKKYTKKHERDKDFGVIIYDAQSKKVIEEIRNLSNDVAYEIYSNYLHDSRRGAKLIQIRAPIDDIHYKLIADTAYLRKPHGSTTKL